MSFDPQPYVNLLIKQYFDQPRAAAEIEIRAQTYGDIADIVAELYQRLDIDVAAGDQLDKIGSLVDFRRTRSDTVPAQFQGDTPSQLNDDAYRLLIKAKIASNAATAFLTSDDRISIQDVIAVIFGNTDARVTDNYDMTLRLTVAEDFGEDEYNFIIESGLLPKPQGVRYRFEVAPPTFEKKFAFDGDHADGDAGGFSSLAEPTIGGAFVAGLNTETRSEAP